MKSVASLKTSQIKDQVCVLRVDFNVENTKDALRLEASLPTIRVLLKKGARLLILSHRGRPNGRESKHSLKIFQPFLRKSLKQEVVFLKDVPKALPEGRVFLLENLRFWKEEESNSPAFAKRIARLGSCYVNDAFAVSHRNNASITQLPKLLPAYAGLLLEKEVKTLSAAIKKPKKPLVVILGGAKMQDKVPIIKNLLPMAHRVLTGSSIIKAVKSGIKIPSSEKVMKPIDWVGEGGAALDIGPLTVSSFKKEIKRAKTIIWNGPLGWFEKKPYAQGSIAMARAVANSKAFTIVGGGETTQLILHYGFRKKISFLSTGGGAMLDFLSGKKLPGIKALK